MPNRAILTLLVLVTAASAQEQLRREGPTWSREVKGTISTTGANRLRLVSRGRITVRPDSSSSEIRYAWIQRVRTHSESEAREQVQSLSVRSRTWNEWCVVYAEAPESVYSELTVSVPAALRQYVFDTQMGGISARGLAGDVHAETAAGNVEMEEIGGSVVARTGGGAMTFGVIKGSLRCLSGGGSIRIGRIDQESVIETAGGEIWIERAGGPVRASTAGNIHIGDAESTVSAHTLGGLIEVERARGIVTAESAGGSILIGSAGGVRAESAGGTIKMKNVSGAIRASTASGNLYVALAAGRALENSFLATARGDITVYVPSNTAVTVKALNESSGYYGRIISDFPEVRAQVPGMMGSGRPVLAEGSINGGGPTLMLSVNSGTVFLKRSK